MKPTRVDDNSATLIDYITANSFDVYLRHKQGILIASIADRYAIVHIAGNGQFQLSISNCKTFKRDMRHQSMQEFLHEMKILNWNQAIECDDAR